MELNELKTHTNVGEMDPLEKWERDLALTRDEWAALDERLSEKVDREYSFGEMGDLIDKHLAGE